MPSTPGSRQKSSSQFSSKPALPQRSRRQQDWPNNIPIYNSVHWGRRFPASTETSFGGKISWVTDAR
ncbi:hypothetical protein KSP40_PGU022381 [Platanthera guangdongensis]|uniref:Uncharacterized protein n=1 Tax=Platanthera guangdongensis TaxID=2320717 RepID=A0ABR2LGP8_9ASPA